MRIVRLYFVFVAGWFFANAGHAEQPYLFDLLKQKPYDLAWNAMLKGEKKVDPWIVRFGKTYEGVTDQVKTVVVDGETDTIGWVCKPHDCGDNQLTVLFAPGGASAWAMLVSNNGIRWFGRPGDTIKAALTTAAKQQ